MKAGRKSLTRSEVMSRIRGKDTGPELALRRALWNAGCRYRAQWRHASGGRIDLAFPRLKVAVLVDGCFWHGCPLHGVRPKSNTAFWDGKLRRNRERDAAQTLDLVRDGWLVYRFWEHQVADLAGLQQAVDSVLQAVNVRSGRAG